MKSTPLLINDGGAEPELRKRITEVYVKYGQHRSLPAESFADEMSTLSGMMLSDIKDDRKLSTLHTGEIGYAFAEGIKGRLFRDDSIGVNYRLMARWLDAYVNYPERQAAYIDSRRNERRLQAHKYSDEEIWEIIRREYSEYCDWRARSRCADGAVAEICGDMPHCYDYGGVYLRFLHRNAKGADRFGSLQEVFEHWFEEGVSL